MRATVKTIRHMGSRRALALLVGLTVASPNAGIAQVPPLPILPGYSVGSVRTEKVAMRDGTKLVTYIVMPASTKGPVPVVFSRTMYDPVWIMGIPKRTAEVRFWTAHGYAFVAQLERGNYGSEGDPNYEQRWGEDSYDTMTWIARQPWSTGKIGTFGCSHGGNNQPAIATMGHPAYKAAIILHGGDGMASGTGNLRGFWTNGNIGHGTPERLWEFAYGPVLASHATSLGFAGNPASAAGAQRYDRLPLAEHAPKPDNPIRYFDDGDTWHVPTIWTDGWYDYAPGETLNMFQAASGSNAANRTVARNQHAIIMPTGHCFDFELSAQAKIGDRPIDNINFPVSDTFLKWFDYWLKGQGPRPSFPAVQYHVEGAGQWRSSEQWPPADTRFVSYYLDSAKGANSRFGDGRLTTTPQATEMVDRFTYDPSAPVPTVGGMGEYVELGDDPKVPLNGAFDQSAVETRDDVLVYTSPVMTSGIEVTGSPEVTLYVSSSAKDTDFTVKLVDVYPNGVAYNVRDRTFRARYRDGGGSAAYTPPGWMPKWLEPGKVYELTFKMQPTSNWFGIGHRIRIEVSSSNFPDSVRNLNTGGDNLTEATIVTAHNAVFHSPRYRSKIVFPVRPTAVAAR